MPVTIGAAVKAWATKFLQKHQTWKIDSVGRTPGAAGDSTQDRRGPGLLAPAFNPPTPTPLLYYWLDMNEVRDQEFCRRLNMERNNDHLMDNLFISRRLRPDIVSLLVDDEPEDLNSLSGCSKESKEAKDGR